MSGRPLRSFRGRSAAGALPILPEHPAARTGLQAAALAALVCAAYVPAMRAGFVWDDALISASAAVREWGGIWKLWFDPAGTYSTARGLGSGDTVEGHYWPLVYTTFWLEHKLWGFEPAGYHLVNLALHAANSVLAWRLLRALGVPGAWFAAALFAVHPLHVESVAWVIERKDVLSGLCYLGAALVWFGGGAPPRGWRYAAAIALFIAAMLSKSIVATLPVALLIAMWWKDGRIARADALRVLPLLAIGIGIALGDTAFYRTREALDLDYSFVERALIAARALLFYAGKLALPTDLAVVHPPWDASAANAVNWLCLAGAAAIPAALWALRGRIGRGPLAGALYFAATLGPVLGFVDYGYMQFSLVADRHAYLACLGVLAVFAGVAAQAVGRIPGRAAALGAAAAAAALLAAAGTLAWRQASIYRDEVTFFSHILAHNPNARSAAENLAAALLDIGEPLRRADRFEEALVWYRKAIAAYPEFAAGYAAMGDALVRLERFADADAALTRALALQPDLPVAAHLHVLLGRAKEAAGDGAAAAEHYQRALDLEPARVEAISRLGALRFAQERYAQALELFQRAAGVQPDDAQTWSNIGAAHYLLGRPREALASLDEALRLNPQLASALANREQIRAALAASPQAAHP